VHDNCKIITGFATDVGWRLFYSTVNILSGADNEGLWSLCDCLLSPYRLAHSDLDNYKQQVAETAFFGNEKADIVTSAIQRTDKRDECRGEIETQSSVGFIRRNVGKLFLKTDMEDWNMHFTYRDELRMPV
jgi:hypothetical protein